MNNKVISVITITLNAEKSLPQTIRSVKNQQLADDKFEHIICDGGSTDNTIKIAKKYKLDNKYVKVYSQHDKGIYDAMNKSLSYATGEYVIFLNSGDCFVTPVVLQNIIKKISIHNHPDIIYGDTLISYLDGSITKKRKIFNWTSMIFANTICHQSVFARKSLFKEHAFDLTYSYCADREWIYYMYYNKKRFKHTFEYVVNYDGTGVSSSDTAKEEVILERYRLQKRYCPYFYYFHRTLREFVKIWL